MPTGRFASVTTSIVIFDELRSSTASEASESRPIVLGFLVALAWRWRVSLCTFGFFAVLMIDDRFGNAVFPQVFANEHNFQVLLRNWINTLAMLAAVASVVVLLLSRRQEPVPDAEPRQERRYVPAS